MTQSDYIVVSEVVRDSCPMSGRFKVAAEFCRRFDGDPLFDPITFIQNACVMDRAMAERVVRLRV